MQYWILRTNNFYELGMNNLYESVNTMKILKAIVKVVSRKSFNITSALIHQRPMVPLWKSNHCVKYVKIRSYFWSVFSCIWTLSIVPSWRSNLTCSELASKLILHNHYFTSSDWLYLTFSPSDSWNKVYIEKNVSKNFSFYLATAPKIPCSICTDFLIIS